MIQRPLLLSLFFLAATATVAVGQNDETQFNERQAKALNSFAKRAFDKGFPRIAKVVWLQTIKLYDPDNKDAWTSLGYIKIGSSWNPDPKKPYPTKDTGKGSDGKPLESKYRSLQQNLAKQHRAQALKYDKADRKDRALPHWRMVLRWVDDDAEAKQALEYKPIGALSGTPLEKTLYDRSKMIEKAVEEQSKVDYPVETVADVECEPLKRAQLPYITVRSEHFTLHGDAEEEENLHKALVWAERSLRVSQVAFPWSYKDSRWPNDWVCLVAKESYHQVLKANEVQDLEWKLENGTGTSIGNTSINTTPGAQTMFDSCARNVAQGYSGFAATGYREGIGHTFVGMMFNKNRLFAIDRKRQEGTAASEEDREFQSPDFDVWKTLSLEMAWKNTGVPAKMLPFVDASAFSNEERIKSWSFCDYMMRRDPEMLRTMDAIAVEMKAGRRKQPAEFEEKFKAKHEVAIADLEKEWQDFWTEASPVLKAIQNNTPPISAISKGVDKWLEAFNKERQKYNRTPVTWSANFSTRCKDHVDYLKANKTERGPAAEHTQKVDLGGSYASSLFAQMAVVETGTSASKAKKVFEKWLYLPGYRDLFINHTLLSIGMYVDGNIMVMNATSGIGKSPDKGAGADCFPPRNDTNLIFDREVAVADLGPEAEKLLGKHGREGQEMIGFPLTAHFGSTGGIGVRGTMACNVTTDKGDKIEGVLVFDGGEVRTTSAPGMAVFWPLDPLPKGKIQFTWTWMGSNTQQKLTGKFSAR